MFVETINILTQPIWLRNFVALSELFIILNASSSHKRQGITRGPVSKWEICTVRNVGCEHTSYSSLQCSLWEHPFPHHSLPTCLIIHSCWGSLHLPFCQLNYRCTQVSQELFELLKSMQELQPDEAMWVQPTRFAPSLTAGMAGQRACTLAVSHKPPLWNTKSKAQNQQICSRNPHLRGYSHCFHPYVLSSTHNSLMKVKRQNYDKF